MSTDVLVLGGEAITCEEQAKRELAFERLADKSVSMHIHFHSHAVNFTQKTIEIPEFEMVHNVFTNLDPSRSLQAEPDYG